MVRIRFPPALSHTNLIIATRRRVRCGAKPWAAGRSGSVERPALAVLGPAPWRCSPTAVSERARSMRVYAVCLKEADPADRCDYQDRAISG